MMQSDLTKGSITKHIRRLAVPATVGFFFNTMYNVVDTFYAGLISTDALAAMSVSFPVFFVIIAFASGLSIGTSALVSNVLGAKDKRLALRISCQAFTFSVLTSIVLMALGFLAAPFLFRLLGAEGGYLDLALSYINIIIWGMVFFLLTHVLNSLLVASGDTKTLRNVLVMGFFLNLVLDPWFLFGGFGLPAMGLKGIALATVLIMALKTLIIFLKVRKKGLLDFSSYKKFLPDMASIRIIIRQSLPASLDMMTVAVGIFVITYYLGRFGSSAVAAYGIATRIEQIALMPMIGLNMATLSVIGQNNGAGLILRVEETLKKSLKYGLFITAAGSVLILLFASRLMMLFSDDPGVIQIGITALRVAAFAAWSYVLLYLNIAALQGLKRPMYAIFIGTFRQVAAPLLVFGILVDYLGYGIMSVWLGVLAINWAAALVTVYYTTGVISRLKEE